MTLPTESAQGLFIENDGHVTRLKWHRLRRRMADPLFSAAAMAEGFGLGASMELDLRVRRDGGFVVLHDDVLEGETTGHGPVAEADAAALRRLRFSDRPEPLILSEDLAAMMRASHPDALLQFDMKDDLAEIGEAGVDHLVTHFADPGAAVIVSGSSLELIVALRERLPNVLRGIDPTDKLVDLWRAEGLSAVEADLRTDLRGPTAPDTVYLAWELVLGTAAEGLDLIAMCQAEGKRVDAWTFTLADPAAGFSESEWANFSTLMALRPDQITTDEAVATEAAWSARTR